MKSPITGKEMTLKREHRTLTFRKEEFNVVYHYYQCEDSQEQFTDAELDEINMNQLYNQYREAHKLPFPDEIIALREKYRLPAIKMAEVLGFGVNVFRNYESGEVPNESNARLLQLAKDPNKFKELIEISQVYEGNELKRIITQLDRIIEEDNKNLYNVNIHDYLLGTKQPNIFSGYKMPSLELLTEMVVFFSKELEPWKTKLNKLLFYADFLQFKKFSFAISGIRYRAIDMGPVPNNFNSIFEYIVNNDEVDIQQKEFADGKIGERFIPNPKRNFNPEIFTEDELKTLRDISIRFGKTDTNDIIDISHEERGWKENFQAGKKLISYNYSFDLIAV
jgi:putative zinc finger/helix-turn-helix YgiT family protein